jgi:molybdopterin synthase sulfur carrier subunit
LKVTIRYFASIREIVGVQQEIMELENGASISDLLKLLERRYGERFNDYVFDAVSGKPRSYLHFMLDGNPVPMSDVLSRVLDHDCELAIIPPVGGGAGL